MYYYFGENRMHQIADAIREKLGIDRGIMASEMPMMIRAISGGGVEDYMPLHVYDYSRAVNTIIEN